MAKKRCHCNGSRGTDCDWCQGSGWVTESIKLNVTPSKAKQVDIDKKPIIKKVFTVVDNKVKEQKKNKPSILKPKKTFDQRVLDLKKEVNQTDTNILEESIDYLRKKIFELRDDLDRIQSRVTKKQRRHFNKIKSETEDIIKQFEKKFIYKKTNVKQTNKVEKKTKLDAEKQHTNKSSLPTLSSKFKELFDNLKEKIRKKD